MIGDNGGVNLTRSVTVDQDLIGRMLRDTVIYVFTRPLALVAWVALTTALIVMIASLVSLAAMGADSGISAWMPVGVLAMMGFFAYTTISAAKRSLRTTMPPGSRVTATVGETKIEIASAKGSSRIDYSAFRQMRVGRDAVLLQVRGVSAVTPVPRALFDDEEIAHIRAAIG